MADQRYITSLALSALARTARAAGIEPGDIDDLEALAPGREAALEACVPLTAAFELWERYLAQSGERNAPLRLARTTPDESRSLVRFLCMTATDVHEGIDFLLRFWPVVTNWYTWFRRAEDAVTIVRAEPTEFERLGARCVREYDVADMLFSGMAATQSPWTPALVCFDHPGDPTPWEETFGCPVRFDHPRTEIHISRDSLSIPLRLSDPGMCKLLMQQAEALLQISAGRISFRSRVWQWLDAHVEDSALGAEAAAHDFGLSVRTFHRKLEDEGESFRKLRDRVRYDRACEWLAVASIAETSERLGFSDPRAFRRAFRRWSGESPTAWRERHIWRS